MDIFSETLTSEFDEDAKLRVFEVSERSLLSQATNKGNQQKWFTEGYYVKSQFYYQNVYWRDDLCEVVASNLCKQLGIYAVKQELCEIIVLDTLSSISGSCSKNFDGADEEFITYSRLESAARLNTLKYNDTAADRVSRALEVYSKVTDLDASQYISNMIRIDYIIGNEDRHMNNFGVIRNAITGSYRVAPLFDFGLSMFEHDEIYLGLNLNKALYKIRCKPFTTSSDKQLEAVDKVIGIKRGGVINLSKMSFPSNKAKNLVNIRAKFLDIEVKWTE